LGFTRVCIQMTWVHLAGRVWSRRWPRRGPLSSECLRPFNGLEIRRFSPNRRDATQSFLVSHSYFVPWLRVNIVPFHCIPGGNRYSVMAKIK
jgi:hypothetical protein